MPKAHHEIATDPTQIVYSRGPWERRAASRREREREKYTRSFIYRAVPFTWIFPGRGRATPLSFSNYSSHFCFFLLLLLLLLLCLSIFSFSISMSSRKE
jgi:hypothetical protein